MPQRSIDASFQSWNLLLQAARKTEAELPGITPFLDAFENAFEAASANRRSREAARAAARQANARMRESVTTARDAATCLRGFIKLILGPRSEKLLRYGMRPRRKRQRTCQTSRKPVAGFEPPRPTVVAPR